MCHAVMGLWEEASREFLTPTIHSNCKFFRWEVKIRVLVLGRYVDMQLGTMKVRVMGVMKITFGVT